MSTLVHPHGGESLKPLLLTGAALKAELARAKTLPRLRVSSREKGDLIMLGIGGFTPLDGFMTHADWPGRVRRLPHGERPVLADSDHAFRRQGGCRGHQDGKRARARRPGLGRDPRDHEGEREIHDRQGARVHVGVFAPRTKRIRA